MNQRHVQCFSGIHNQPSGAVEMALARSTLRAKGGYFFKWGEVGRYLRHRAQCASRGTELA